MTPSTDGWSTPDVRDPRTGRRDRGLTPPTPAHLADTAERLRSGQPRWNDLGPGGRAEILLAWRTALAEHRDELIAGLVADTGRHTESVMEFDSVLGMLERWATQAPELMATPPRQATSVPFVSVQRGLRPYRLVGVISPWNFPLLLALIDAVPALAAGCAVLIKPSEVTPRFIEPLMRTVRAVPELAGVVAVAEGAGDVGAAVIDQVDAVVFTGSVITGRKVAAAASAAFIPAFLELGGKDPAIVLAGADLDRAASAILWGGTANTGQSCLSIERVYVERSIHREFVTRLTAKARAIDLARPGPADGQIGPLIDPDQAQIIEAHLADARDRGATVHTGGSVDRLDGGLWCRPTVLTDVDHTMLIMTEETFGPILPVMAVDNAEAAVRLANDCRYGLSGAVFAGTERQARDVAVHLEAGGISINDAGLTGLVHEGEKHAFKLSGLGGSRMGPASLRRFLRTQAHLIKTEELDDPWWYAIKETEENTDGNS